MCALVEDGVQYNVIADVISEEYGTCIWWQMIIMIIMIIVNSMLWVERKWYEQNQQNFYWGSEISITRKIWF